jgi:CCR4-NOT transcription complex subunit 3
LKSNSTLKKASEGLKTFQEIYQKLEGVLNSSQKEKFESDLKKEIKKLQRLRDQVKGWVDRNDIKEKSALVDMRIKIEKYMELFKTHEKENRGRTYSSRESLSQGGKQDSKSKILKDKEHEREKMKKRIMKLIKILSQKIYALQNQIDQQQPLQSLYIDM